MSATVLPLTICVVCYGRHAELAQSFLTHLYENTSTEHFTLRAGLNEVEEATHQLFDEFSNRFGNIELFVESKNIYKNPMMRRMFYEKPLDSEWVVWFDDDSRPTRRDWLQRLSLRIEREPEVSQWGELYFTEFEPENVIVEIIHKASWYRGLELESRQEGKFLAKFASGGFWATRTDTIHLMDWPDHRLLQAAEDVLMGEALRQHGQQIRSFEYGIEVNSAPRRNPKGFGVNAMRPD